MRLFKLPIICCLAIATPLSAQTLEQAVAITLATNPEIKSIFNEFVSVQNEMMQQVVLTDQVSTLMPVSVTKV